MIKYSIETSDEILELTYLSENENVSISTGNAYHTIFVSLSNLAELRNFIDKVFDRIQKEQWEKERMEARVQMEEQRALAAIQYRTSPL